MVQGTITEIYLQGGRTRARVRIGGTSLRVPLTLLMDARVGDEVVIDSGVAIARVDSSKEEGSYVSGSSG